MKISIVSAFVCNDRKNKDSYSYCLVPPAPWVGPGRIWRGTGSDYLLYPASQHPDG